MSIPQILDLVAELTSVTAEAITGPARHRDILYPRFLAIAAVYHCCPWATLKHVAASFQRTHPSIRHASIRHRDLLETEPGYRRQWQRVLARLDAQSTPAAR